MSIDMAQFYQGFFEESFEGLEVMEQGLMELEPGTPDPSHQWLVPRCSLD